MRLTRFVAVLGLSLVACRGGNTTGDDASTADSPPGGSVTIQQVQDAAMAVGTPVTLDGVVVTAIDSFGARTGDLWVEEAGGGEFSGVKVFGAPLDQIAALQPGDIVTITNAVKDEFALTADMSGRKVTELKGAGMGMMTITKTGTGAVPAPVTVDAKAIEALPDFTARDAEWEKYEGVLINVVNARQLSGVGTFGTNPDQKNFSATGGLVVETVLADFPVGATAATCYTGMVGIGDYFFNYLLLPRASTDLATGGTGCSILSTATVAEVQAGTKTGTVQLNDVFVTGRDRLGAMGKSRGLWVSDSLTAAQNTGVYVFTGSVPDVSLAIGAKVSLIGTTQEFDVSPPVGDTLTELSNSFVTLTSAPTSAPIPATTTAAVAGSLANGEAFEGVLVKMTTLKVTMADAGQGKVELTDNANGKVLMDNDSFVFAAQVLNTCYASVTGVMSVQLFDNVRTVNPRSATDMVVGAGCN